MMSVLDDFARKACILTLLSIDKDIVSKLFDMQARSMGMVTSGSNEIYKKLIQQDGGA